MGGGGGKGKQCVTTGYRYFAGLHLIFCHALDACLGIRVGEKWAWNGAVTSNSTIMLNQYNLFGGEAREGGVMGNVDFCFGGPTQPQNTYLRGQLGAGPAYRGLFGLVANCCMLSANNPYVKEWSILGRRSRIGWRDDLADVVAGDGQVDMNPAHIILEALTNTTWGGLGYPLADIDLPSFQAAANLLQAEGFGLSLLWAKNTSIEEFVALILNHIDGRLYFAHTTGLLKLKLVRNDYSIGGLPVLNASNILELVEYTGPTAVEAVNQVTVNWVDRDNQPQAVTVQDLAGFARTQGRLSAVSLDFVGIADANLAARVAARELQQLCMPIASCTLVVNRQHSTLLEPGECFNFTWEPLGIVDMSMRIDTVEIGLHTDSQLRVTAVRDVYGLGTVQLTTPSSTLWTTPLNAPGPSLIRQVTEMPWLQFVQVYGDSAAVLAELDDTSTLVIACCARPSADAINYELWDRNVGATEWNKRDVDSFPFVASLVDAVVPEVSSTLTLDTPLDTTLITVGTYAALGSELVAITALDPVLNTITVDRGVLDTVPVDHDIGTTLWCYQYFCGIDPTPRAAGEAVEVRILPATPTGLLPLADAPTDPLTATGRMMRPYPPGNVQINGIRWPASIGAAAALALTWSHRDRTVQTVTLNRQDEGDIGPEAGVTYTLRLYGEAGTLKKTVTGITTTSYTWSSEVADSGLGRLNTTLRFELEAVRGSLTSRTPWNIAVIRA